jgi:putative FmdB family regulatory protein
MPVYEYEYQQRMSDPDKTACEACGGALERLVSRTAFQLKGGGW